MLTRRYASGKGVPASVRPSRGASALVRPHCDKVTARGHPVREHRDLSRAQGHLPEDDDVVAREHCRSDGRDVRREEGIQTLRTEDLRVVPGVNGLVELAITRIGPPGPSLGGGGGGAAVVNVDVNVDARALLAASLTRGSVAPPLTVRLYIVELSRPDVGVRVAVSDPADQVTLEGTRLFVGLRSSMVEVLIVDASIDSLNTMDTGVLIDAPDAPFAGDTELTVGGVVSGATLVAKTISTQ